jgi:hypothetical protein
MLLFRQPLNVLPRHGQNQRIDFCCAGLLQCLCAFIQCGTGCLDIIDKADISFCKIVSAPNCKSTGYIFSASSGTCQRLLRFGPADSDKVCIYLC